MFAKLLITIADFKSWHLPPACWRLAVCMDRTVCLYIAADAGLVAIYSPQPAEAAAVHNLKILTSWELIIIIMLLSSILGECDYERGERGMGDGEGVIFTKKKMRIQRDMLANPSLTCSQLLCF